MTPQQRFRLSIADAHLACFKASVALANLWIEENRSAPRLLAGQPDKIDALLREAELRLVYMRSCEAGARRSLARAVELAA